jgi:hypothetical protein
MSSFGAWDIPWDLIGADYMDSALEDGGCEDDEGSSKLLSSFGELSSPKATL